MSERAVQRAGPRTTVHFIRYTRDEIEQAWNAPLEAQGHRAALKASLPGQSNPMCVILPVTEEEKALTLAAMFVRFVFAMPTCTYWDGFTLVLNCAEAGSGWRETKIAALEMLLNYPGNVPDDLWAAK